MTAQILTVEHLKVFKAELFLEIQKVVQAVQLNRPRKWIKSYDVRKMLGISAGTLQNMRLNGTVSYTKVGGLVFYDYDYIVKMMEDKKSDRHGR